MLILAGFSPIIPDVGLVLWTSVIFLLVLFILSKVAFKPIAQALNDRDKSINDALAAAEKARHEMANLQKSNEEILSQAKEERAAILLEAKNIKDQIIAEAKEKADADFKKKVESAAVEIKNRELEMLTSVRNETGKIALEIAEQIMRRELKGSAEHEAFAQKMVAEYASKN